MITGTAQGFAQQPSLWINSTLNYATPTYWAGLAATSRPGPEHTPKWAREGWQTRRSRAKARRRGEKR